MIGAYHQLWQVENSFPMPTSDLKARPIYHHLKDSNEAHLTIVLAALAIARWLEATAAVPAVLLYRIRNILRCAAERLTETQQARQAAAIAADERHHGVHIAWQCAPRVRAAYTHPDPLEAANSLNRSSHLPPVPHP